MEGTQCTKPEQLKTEAFHKTFFVFIIAILNTLSSLTTLTDIRKLKTTAQITENNAIFFEASSTRTQQPDVVNVSKGNKKKSFEAVEYDLQGSELSNEDRYLISKDLDVNKQHPRLK